MKKLIFIAILLGSSFAFAQTPQQPQNSEIADDTNPSKAVLFSVREEYYKLDSGSWKNAFIFRADKAIFEGMRPLRPKGMILRMDLPVSAARLAGDTQWGLGDTYFQALLFPHLGRKVLFAAGSGILLPTATDSFLGSGKFQIAPLAAFIGFFPPRRGYMEGYFLLKLQDYYSFYGDSDKPDIHYFQVTPTILYRLNRKNFIVLDTEMKTNWLADNRTSFRTGIQFGRMMNRKMGFWIKPEIPWGNNKELDWVLKFTLIFAK